MAEDGLVTDGTHGWRENKRLTGWVVTCLAPPLRLKAVASHRTLHALKASASYRNSCHYPVAHFN